MVASPDPNVEGDTGRRRRAEPRAVAPRGDDPPARRGDIYLYAAGPAGAAEGRPDRPRGDGRRRGARAPHARASAGGALEGVGPLRSLRRPAHEAHDQRRSPDGPGAYPRRSGHRHRPRPRALVQAAPDHALPDPDQVPRRAEAAVRHRADPRVPHEGRVQHRRRPGPAQYQLRQDVRGLLPHLRPLRTPLCDRRGGERADRRRLVARIHGPLLHRRGHGHRLRQVRLRGQPGARRGRRPRPPDANARRRRRPPTRPSAPPASGRSARSASSSGSTRRPRPSCWSTWPTASRPPRSCGAITSSTRPSSAGRSGPRVWSRPTRPSSRRPRAPPWASSGRWESRSRW